MRWVGGYDWLEQLCLTNIDNRIKHTTHFISRLFHFSRSKLVSNNCQKKHFSRLFHVRCADGLILIIYSACIVCVARLMQQSSVRLSVPLINSSSGGRWVCCWMLFGQDMLIDRCTCQRHVPDADVLGSKCGQCHVDRWKRRLNTDLLYI